MSHVAINNPLLTLDDFGIGELTRQYGRIVGQISEGAGLRNTEILISNNAVSLAFAEAAADLEIMSLRRKPKNGISPSKIAGVVAFRLARFAPVNLVGAALENDVAQKLNELAALALALKSIMHIDIDKIASKHVTMELQYTLVRRHMNQETLGLAFEILSHGGQGATCFSHPS
jgi:hypothetical protein